MKRSIFIAILLIFNACSSNNESEPSVTPTTRSIYISDAGDFQNPPWKILKADENGNNVSTFISSNLGWPQDILFLDDQNVVLISNLNTGKITKYNATTGSYISDFATGIAGPTRMKIGPDTLLYVLQWNANYKVKRYKLDGTPLGDFTEAGVNASIGLDWDSDGNLYVSSYYDDYVRKFGPTGNDLGPFIETNLAGPTNIWFGANGDLFVSDYDGGAIKRFDSSGSYLGVYITGLGQSEGVAFFENGSFLIGNGSTHSVKMYDNTGKYIKDLIKNGTAGLKTPNAIVIH